MFEFNASDAISRSDRIVPDDALDFAARLLHMEAAQRPSASAALEHPYFVAEPTPVPPK
jgi:hypothetical protein